MVLAFGDNGSAKRLIRTITGKGARLVGEVIEMPEPAASPVDKPALPQRHHLRERLRAVIAEAAESLQGGAIVIAEDARIRTRRTPPGD